jgi:LysR family transcriptional regulator, hydrogen peroxide-inducible genes activator
MKNLPSLKNVHYFVQLYHLKSFQKAAKICGVSQSTLSVGIQNLEQQLGGCLIERNRKSFLFTALGEEVVIRCQHLLAQTAELIEYSRSDDMPFQGVCRLGCIPTIAPYLMPDVVLQIQQQWPDFNMILTENTEKELLKKLAQGELDVLVCAQPLLLDNFHQQTIGHDALVLVCHESLRDNLQYPLRPSRLDAQSYFLIGANHCQSLHQLQSGLIQNEATVHPHYIGHLSTLIHMVDTHRGFTLIPQMSLVKNILQGSNVVAMPMPPAKPKRDICLVWRQQSYRLRAFRELAELIEKQLLLLS